MKRWWIRPLIRMLAAFLLPLLVPGVITMMIWALPGDPASIICPPEECDTAILSKEFKLDQGAWFFFSEWISGALGGDFGVSWRVMQGLPVRELIEDSISNTIYLLLLALIPIGVGGLIGATGRPQSKWDPLVVFGGIIPVVVLSLIAAAVVEIEYAGLDLESEANRVRLLVGALTLGLADAAFSGTLLGVRNTFSRENNQRYVGVSILRGETVLSNTLPNVSNALVGQFRSRVLHILSGLVIVEVIVQINGVGALLWEGTLLQDFGVVLAAATIFAVFSAVLIFVQAFSECLIALHIYRTPKDVLPAVEGI